MPLDRKSSLLFEFKDNFTGSSAWNTGETVDININSDSNHAFTILMSSLGVIRSQIRLTISCFIIIRFKFYNFTSVIPAWHSMDFIPPPPPISTWVFISIIFNLLLPNYGMFFTFQMLQLKWHGTQKSMLALGLQLQLLIEIVSEYKKQFTQGNSTL